VLGMMFELLQHMFTAYGGAEVLFEFEKIKKTAIFKDNNKMP
jgi:hypothetical protein